MLVGFTPLNCVNNLLHSNRNHNTLVITWPNTLIEQLGKLRRREGRVLPRIPTTKQGGTLGQSPDSVLCSLQDGKLPMGRALPCSPPAPH